MTTDNYTPPPQLGACPHRHPHRTRSLSQCYRSFNRTSFWSDEPLWAPSDKALRVWNETPSRRRMCAIIRVGRRLVDMTWRFETHGFSADAGCPRPDEDAILKSFCRHATKTLARSSFNMDNFAAYHATAYSVRDRLLDKWNATQQYHTRKSPKRVYYLSLEFLLGRTMDNAILNMVGFRLEDLVEEELDAALGNGGLGRLAACFMDSMATLDYPAWGYGIRYNYGIFQQRIIDGYQTEFPTTGSTLATPGKSSTITELGEEKYIWEGGEKIIALQAKKEFDFASFNEGQYDKSVEEQKVRRILLPNDNHMVGKILRLKQQYFFVSATLQDIIRRFKKSNVPWSEFPNHVSIQLNDTHPTLGVVELQRMLIDEEGLSWDDAWDMLPRLIRLRTILCFLRLLNDGCPAYSGFKVEARFPGDREKLRRMSIIEEGHPQHVRMAFLACVGSHTVNGVAALHSALVKSEIFPDFVDFFGAERFTNVTNGITPRRWLNQANPGLGELITDKLGSEDWVKHLDLIADIKKYAEDKHFQVQWMNIKRLNKVRLAEYIKATCKIAVSPDALFDIQCKRFHEYKRQFMNILGVIHRYQQLKSMSASERLTQTPKVVIFSGKSAPGYYIAKLIIKLINNVAERVNGDEETNEKLKLIFIPNYNVSVAEIIIPASDISQHISTAGTEASGTSNMKFVLNGGLIIGTVDGANIEIAEEVGDENIWMFGALTPEVEDIRHNNRFRGSILDPSLAAVVESVRKGEFGDAYIFEPLMSTLTTGHDFYIISHDFASYLQTLEKIDVAFKDKSEWAKKSILAAASMGKSIRDYAEKIWHIKPVSQE
ncbi:hypothetical protein BC829DRAFT_446690 [Chytridium lagenaria]|nr:hypothetical protein BC829DRAFT_446690 [Chytridium lagenaria]